MTIKTLAECFPDLLNGEFDDTKAYEFRNVHVLEERFAPWKGTHKNVHLWVELFNGYAVGWNENPVVGYSFPVMKIKGA